MIYRLDYCNAQGDKLRLDIQYGSNTVVSVEGTESPFTLNYKGDKDDKSLNFLTSSADISLFETEDFNIDMLKTSSEVAISVKYYVNSNLFWQGYVIPDFFSKEITGTPIINMVASDRLSTLKSVSLAGDTLPSMITFRELAIKCLQKTGLSLPLKTIANFSNGTGSTTDGFFTSKVLTQRLSDTKGRNISCYDILDSILTASGSKLMQRGGEWVIINKDQHERGVGTAFNTPITNTTPTSNHAWSEVVHNFSDIDVGGRRTIIPVASSVGVYQEYGGGLSYPENYDFSNGLTGWTKVNGFVGDVDNRQVDKYSLSGLVFTPIYGSATDKYYLKSNRNDAFEDENSPYIRSSLIDIIYPDNESVNIAVTINASTAGSYIFNSFVEFAVIARKGDDMYSLDASGLFNAVTNNKPHIHRIKYPTIRPDLSTITLNKKVEGVLTSNDTDLSGYTVEIRIYGSGSNQIPLIHSAVIDFSLGYEIPKGTIHKVEQGDNFTKVHDLSTSIFGDYLTNGVNGYFYNYPIDDTSSIYNSSNVLTSLWTTPTAPHDTSEQPLLLHIARHRARMFSIAHDLLDVSLDINDFDPLKIFVDCFGRRYVVVASEFDLLRSRARVTIEQIAFSGTIFKQDFIYSYFGEGEKGISSVGGVTGGSSGGGGTSAPQYWYLDEDGNLRTDYSAYSTKELSAYGLGSGGGGGGGGIIETVYSYSNLGQSFNNATLTDTFNAYTINQINTRLTAVEAGGGSNYVPTSRIITAGIGLTGGGDLTANITLALDTVYTDNRYYGYTDSAIEGIEIGGRNLRKDTSGDVVTSTTATNEVKLLISFGTHYFEANKEYTVSFDFKTDGVFEQLNYNYLWNEDGLGNTSIGSVHIIDDGEWHRYSHTFKFNVNRQGHLRLGADSRVAEVGDNIEYSYRYLKLEKGNKATDWSPAPEDVQAEIDLKAPINNPIFTGLVTAPSITTPSHGTSANWNEAYQWFNTVGRYWEYDSANNALKTSKNVYSAGEVSAYGVGSGGGGGGGIIETVYGYSNLGQSFNNATLTDTFNAYTINQINTRLTAVEAGGGSNDGQLTLNTGTGLTGSATFTANQSTNSTFTVSPVFGTTVGTIAQGNDSRIVNGQTAYGWGNHASAGYALNSSLANYVPTSRIITAGIGLTGGGDLSTNRALSLDTTYTDGRYVRSVRVITTEHLDDITQEGAYRQGSSSDASVENGYPSGAIAGILTVWGGNLYTKQIYKNRVGEVWERFYWNTWLPWREVAFTDSNITGNAATATTLQTARTINGTSFDGSANITTANWGTARTISIGGTAKSVNGSSNVTWATSEIDAQTAVQLATSRNIWGRPFNGSANVTGSMTGVTSIAMSAALTGATILNASQNINTPKVSLGSNWTIEQSGIELQFKYGGVTKQRLFQDGSFAATGEVAAYSEGVASDELQLNKLTLLQGGGDSKYLSSTATQIFFDIGGATPLSMTKTEVRRGTTDTNVSLGTSAYPWANIYGVNLIASTNLTTPKITLGNGWTIEQTSASLTIRRNGEVKGTFNA